MNPSKKRLTGRRSRLLLDDRLHRLRSSSRRLSALLTYVGAIGVYVWIISSSGYLDNTMAAFRAGEVINLRDHLVANHQFPKRELKWSSNKRLSALRAEESDLRLQVW